LLWTFGDRAHDVYLHTVPEIHVSGQDSSAFLLPFSVKNNSSMFSMRDAEWTCIIKKAQTGRVILQNMVVGYAGARATIEPSATAYFRCNLTSSSTTNAVIIPRVTFKTLWFLRTYQDTTFTWLGEANPPRTIEGEYMR